MMKHFIKSYNLIIRAIAFIIYFTSCSEEQIEQPVPDTDTTQTDTTSFDINQIRDTYAEIAPLEFHHRWGPYNVHDPSVLQDGEYFYCYSTDAGYGMEVPPGIQIRRSKDLIAWEFVGWAFPGLPPQGADFIRQQGGTPFEALWAPYIMRVGSEYRLYYSLSSPTPRLSVIGLATASSPLGPWKEKGLVVTSRADNTVQTNAIDPGVLVDQQGVHWLYYGSAWDGIYVLQLNPATGLAANGGAKGKRIAQRGFTGNRINGNIEAPEVIYNSEFNKYYLFIAYDWLETKYNVRVGRADAPEGPFYDFHGNDLNEAQDNIPMILAPYRLEGHSGWQGTAHCTVFQHEGQYYMVHQGRPGEDKFFMVMHVRKIFWTEAGWPIVSPERYAGIEQTPVAEEELTGEWEQIVLNYQVVSGYADEQVSPDFQESVALHLNASGAINDNADNQWSYDAPWLTLNWDHGLSSKVRIERARDWENKHETLIFTGLTDEGIAVWGKKKY